MTSGASEESSYSFSYSYIFLHIKINASLQVKDLYVNSHPFILIFHLYSSLATEHRERLKWGRGLMLPTAPAASAYANVVSCPRPPYPHPGVASAVYDHITSALPTDGLFGRRSIVVARRRTDERACCREYLHWKIGPD